MSRYDTPSIMNSQHHYTIQNNNHILTFPSANAALAMIIAAVVNDSFMVDLIMDDDDFHNENLWQQLLHFFCNETKVQAHKVQMKLFSR